MAATAGWTTIRHSGHKQQHCLERNQSVPHGIRCVECSFGGMFCHHWQEVDHTPPECALLALDPSLGGTNLASQRRTAPSPARNCPSPYDMSVDLCRRFNRGQCNDPAYCRYRHIWSTPECKRYLCMSTPLGPKERSVSPTNQTTRGTTHIRLTTCWPWARLPTLITI